MLVVLGTWKPTVALFKTLGFFWIWANSIIFQISAPWPKKGMHSGSIK